MNKILILIILLCNSFMLFAEELPTTLVVWAKDGTKVSYALNEQPKITFTEECLLITTTKVEVSYKLAQMARFTYENTDVNAIIDVNGKTVNPFTFNGDVLLFPASGFSRFRPRTFHENPVGDSYRQSGFCPQSLLP